MTRRHVCVRERAEENDMVDIDYEVRPALSGHCPDFEARGFVADSAKIVRVFPKWTTLGEITIIED